MAIRSEMRRLPPLSARRFGRRMATRPMRGFIDAGGHRLASHFFFAPLWSVCRYPRAGSRHTPAAGCTSLPHAARASGLRGRLWGFALHVAVGAGCRGRRAGLTDRQIRDEVVTIFGPDRDHGTHLSWHLWHNTPRQRRLHAGRMRYSATARPRWMICPASLHGGVFAEALRLTRGDDLPTCPGGSPGGRVRDPQGRYCHHESVRHASRSPLLPESRSVRP